MKYFIFGFIYGCFVTMIISFTQGRSYEHHQYMYTLIDCMVGASQKNLEYYKDVYQCLMRNYTF